MHYSQCHFSGYKYVRIIQSHGSFEQPETLSRNGLIDLHAGTQLSFLSNYPSQSLQWTAFRLGNILSQLFAFQVAKSSTAFCCGLITYDLVFLNIGSAWNIASNLFIAPRSGQYFFSICAGFFSNQLVDLSFIVNGNNVKQITQNGAASKITSGMDFHSASKLLQLNTGDSLKTTFIYPNNANLYSELANLQISLTGFYYSPTINSPVSVILFSTELKLQLMYLMGIRVYNYGSK